MSFPDAEILRPYADSGLGWLAPLEIVRGAAARPVTDAELDVLFAGWAAKLAARVAVLPDRPGGLVMYHRTTRFRSAAIMDEGFRDQPDTPGTREGIYVSNVPVDNGGVLGPLFEIVVGLDESEMAPFEETLEDCPHPYREWKLPARLLNDSPVRLLSREEQDEITHQRTGCSSHVVQFGPCGDLVGRTIRPPAAPRLTSHEWREILGIDHKWASYSSAQA